MPVEVVGGQIQHHSRERPDRGAPVQLKARQLHSDDRVGLRVGHYVEDRSADVPGSNAAMTSGREHGSQHPDCGRLAVGPGDGQPLLPAAARQFRPQPPGQFNVADHLDARGDRGREQRRVGPQPGRGDYQRGAWRHGRTGAELLRPEPDRRALLDQPAGDVSALRVVP